MRKPGKKNLICAASAILIVAAYFFIDGFGMMTQGFKIANSLREDGSSVFSYQTQAGNDVSGDGAKNAILQFMKDAYYTRMIILSVCLIPIVFVALRYFISLKNKEKSQLNTLIVFFRPIFGLVIFYYILTFKTVFSHELFSNYFSFGHWLSFFRIIAAFGVFGAFVIDWPAFWKAIKCFPSSHPVLYKSLFVTAISVCSCMLVEFQIASKMNMTTNMLLFNILYWMIVQVFVDVLTRNVKIGSFISLGFSYLIGLVNDIVYQFRGNYVMYGDLTVVRTAMEVAGKYTYKPEFWFWLSLAILLCAVTITIILRFPKPEKPGMKEILIRAGVEAALVGCVLFTFSNGKLYNNVFGVGWDYNTNVRYTGYLPYFLSNMNSIEKVSLDGYDVSEADLALSKNADKTENYKSPNIIIIQNEAFSDLSVLYDIKTNQDYMPFIRGLSKNTRKGYLNMSITGGPTANTEFEILMRSSLSFLPYGSVPYTQYVNSDLPSIAEVLKSQPVKYHTVAYHPYYTSGYRRNEVYGHFGFDDIYFEDDFKTARPNSDLIRDYLSDSADYKKIESLYEEWRKTSDAPWFCFNVTIQNHGGYTQEFVPSKSDSVYVTNFEAPDSVNNYLSLIKVSDNAFRELIEYFSNCSEPTIIAMYGDHQPSFEAQADEVLKNYLKDGDKASANNYYVPYIIWANYDIEEEDSFCKLNTLSTNYFASTVFKYAGIKLSDYDRYLLDLHERVPALTAIGAWDSTGKYYSSPKAAPYSEDLFKLEMIQYNLIFDDEKRLKDRFR